MVGLAWAWAFAPVVLLGTAAGFAAAAGAGATIGAPLLLIALGCLVGLASGSLALRRNVGRLTRAVAQIPGDHDRPLAAAARYGPLSPVADELTGVVHALRTAREEATTDRLTHVASRGHLLARLFEELERVGRYNRPLSVAFVDIDHFKSVNDTYGHEVGDQVLQGVAGVIRNNLRNQDTVGRYGVEEFVLVLPETTIDEATVVAEKLRLLVLKERYNAGPGASFAVSVSIGVAGGQGAHLRVDQLLRDADAAMYSAKALGRNQTYVFAETDDDSSRIPRAPISADGRARAVEVSGFARQAAEAALSLVVASLPSYRGKPSALIATIAVRIARELGLPDQETERIRIASLLHDLGKVGVPEEILEKPGSLSDDEWQSVVQHPRIGQVIIDQVAAIKDAGTIILHHHEEYAGHGYPHGLRGTEIPLGARIVAIADAYDAMTNDRPYRASIGHRAAIEELRRRAEIQFDPELVDLFCKLYTADPPVPDDSLLITQPALPTVLRPRRARSRAVSA
jgi:diguanylate cyclase (GGDEF)-like protein